MNPWPPILIIAGIATLFAMSGAQNRPSQDPEIELAFNQLMAASNLGEMKEIFDAIHPDIRVRIETYPPLVERARQLARAAHPRAKDYFA